MTTAARVLALLSEENTPAPAAEYFIGVVTASTSASVTVQPDSGSSFEVGPMPLVGTSAPGVGKRVLCIKLPGAGHGCLGVISG